MEFRTRILLAKALSLAALPVVPKPVFERKVKKSKKMIKLFSKKMFLTVPIGSHFYVRACLIVTKLSLKESINRI